MDDILLGLSTKHKSSLARVKKCIGNVSRATGHDKRTILSVLLEGHRQEVIVGRCTCFADVLYTPEGGYITDTGSPAAECNVCETIQCKECIMAYSISNMNLPKCCKVGGCPGVFDAYTLLGWFSEDDIESMDPLIMKCLLDIELSLIPESEKQIARIGYAMYPGRVLLPQSEEELIRGRRIHATTTAINVVGDLETSLQTTSSAPVGKLIIMCGQDGCSGVLDETTFKCKKCGKKKCKKCREPKLPRHVCDEGILANQAMARRLGSTCPGCGNVIEKTVACDHMWCDECETSFTYVPGGLGIKIPNSANTNPAYYAWRKRQQAKGVNVDEPNTGHVLSRDEVVRVVAMAHLDHEHADFVLGLYRLTDRTQGDTPYNRTYGMQGILNTINTTLSRDSELERQRVILAKNRVVLQNVGLLMKAYPELPSITVNEGDRCMYSEKECTASLGASAYRLYIAAKAHGYKKAMLLSVRDTIVRMLTSFVRIGEDLERLYAMYDSETTKRVSDIKWGIMKNIKRIKKKIHDFNYLLPGMEMQYGVQESPFITANLNILEGYNAKQVRQHPTGENSSHGFDPKHTTFSLNEWRTHLGCYNPMPIEEYEKKYRSDKVVMVYNKNQLNILWSNMVPFDGVPGDISRLNTLKVLKGNNVDTITFVAVPFIGDMKVFPEMLNVKILRIIKGGGFIARRWDLRLLKNLKQLFLEPTLVRDNNYVGLSDSVEGLELTHFQFGHGSLNLREMFYTDIPVEVFTGSAFRRLTHLKLMGVKMDILDIPEGKFPELEVLDMSSSDFGRVVLQLHTPKLRSLILNRSELTTFGNDALKECHSLSSIDLSYNEGLTTYPDDLFVRCAVGLTVAVGRTPFSRMRSTVNRPPLPAGGAYHV